MAKSGADRAREDVLRAAARFRPELLAHCYRMLGSAHDAEDAVQETLLRAWRHADAFEGRSSLRHWLYRIATRACLTALERRAGAPRLEPLPDLMLAGPDGGDPAAVALRRDGVRLALVVALRRLPPRQRAVLLLRDVLAWRASETAEALGVSVPAVNSALQRARERLGRLPDGGGEEGSAPLDPRRRELAERYARAFEEADAEALLGVVRADVGFAMPPEPLRLSGAAEVVAFLAERVLPGGPDRFRTVLVSANGGRPAVAGYLRREDGVHRPYAVSVLEVAKDGIAEVTAFRDPSLFPLFGLPPVPDGPAAGPSGAGPSEAA
ncbi:hypothetical protein BIV57_03275 [Mangrovactinospora gilvigrisea]|uniref:RNA polymerase subunit sigma-70 n=2 Tax=Mangrovactinospora gilvigrisea TaxID=1428644 RepID=A0A1J7BJQ4_9ACTN|nr:sigma-70 family RNA polymerase sigma factor [Mangrovactinospora gilvigrisea]OIV38915.1 hypothetical protein BIV57_03275 [Mangrovactinospora gilvigrisea]